MTMILNAFLSPLGKSKDLETVSDELFGIINSSQIDTSEYELTLFDWIFNELTFINEIGKLKRKVKETLADHNLFTFCDLKG